MEFKVGDKVRVIVDDHQCFDKGHEFVVDRVDVVGDVYDENGICIVKHRVELVTPKQSKKQRIEALEKEVAELKERVEALEQAEKQRYVMGVDVAKEVHKTPNLDIDLSDLPKETYIKHEGKLYKKVNRRAKAGDVVVFVEHSKHWMRDTTLNEPYLVDEKRKYTDDVGDKLFPIDCDVYEPLEQLKTPNQQRKEIIEKAKERVKEWSKGVHCNAPTSEDIRTLADICNLTVNFSRGDELQFVEDENKRTVVALIRFKNGTRVFHKGIAKCSPDDVFNVHIGRAIALGRALGKDVSEFENAVQPTEAVVGMIVQDYYKFKENNVFEILGNMNFEFINNNLEHYRKGTLNHNGFNARIIDDTNAVYEVEK